MFSFLNRVKKDLGGAVNQTAKVTHKGLNFIGDTADDVAALPKAIATHPVQAAEGVAKGIITPAKELTKAITSTPAAIGREIQNKPINDIQKNVFGSTDSGTIAKKIIGDTLQTGANFVGGGVAKDAVQGTKAVKDLSTVDKLKSSLAGAKTVAKEGAAASGVSSAGSQLSDKGNVNASQTVRDALIGGLLAGSGSVAADAVKTAPKAVKSVEDIASQHPAVLQINDHLKQLNQQRENLAAKGGTEAALKSNAKAYTSALKLRTDTVDAIKQGGYVGNNDGSELQKFTPEKTDTEKIFDNIDKSDLAAYGKDTGNIGLYKFGPHSDEGKTLADKTPESLQQVGVLSQASKSQAVRRDARQIDYILARSSNPTKALKNLEFESLGTPEGRVLQSAVNKLTATDANPIDKNSFIGAVTGDKQYTSQELDDLESAGGREALQSTPTKPGYEPPKTGADFANALLSEGTKGKVQLPQEVVDLLGKTGKDADASSKAPVLEAGQDPSSVLSKHFGKEGADIAYEASQGAKKRSDLQEQANPLIDDAEAKLKKAAKTKAGQADVESRINQALEDRGNADSYLNTPEEKDAYEATKAFYDHYQGHIADAGKGTLENYSPRVARQNADEASKGLDYTVTQAFSKNPDAPFLKERTKEEPDQELLNKPVSTMRGYSSAVSKQLAYEDTLKKLPERLQNVNPIYTLDSASKQRGKTYLQQYYKDLLQPDIPTSGKGLGKLIGEQAQNKLLNRTYSAALSLSPRFGIINRTQGYATRSQVSREARQLTRKMDSSDLESLRSELTSGDNPITGEATSSASNVGNPKTKLQKINAKVSGEQKNVSHAFDSGAAQHIIESPIYKQAIKDGQKPKEAAKAALADPATRDLAVRAGNTVTNTTQFGSNIANKPGWLRESGTVFGLSKKWIQQYKRFQLGTAQLAGNITDPKTARALDIMRRGDPQQTKLVDYLKAAKTLQNALPDAKKTIKAGETEVTKQQYKDSKDLLDKAVKVLNSEIKKNSSIRATKTAKNLGKMWAAASVVQFLFDGATNNGQDKTTGQQIGKAIQYGSPVNVPTKEQNPLSVPVPSSPIGSHGISGRKLLNFVPVVGPVVNRGREAKGLIEALTGSGQ